MRRLGAALAIAGGLAVGLGGCGVKPRDVRPPAGADQALFPRSYPNPALDPWLGPATADPPTEGQTQAPAPAPPPGLRRTP